MLRDRASPRLAIILPVYRHSMLVTEAVHSALAQEGGEALHLVIVNDGCPHPETARVLSTIACADPQRVTVLTRPNGGLSAARNTGITHVLRHLPSVEALFMLDADNRLRPRAMARALAQLDAHPEAGWVYPSIDMFGIAARCDYGGPYSRLVHGEMNICEAGSLIRRAVFDAGVLFDESFKSGFEDWHFFLQAGDAGFRGINLEEFGFFYRKRPESMLAQATRHREALVNHLRAAHPDLYRPATQIRLEHHEAPRYAVWLTDRDHVALVTDPEVPGEAISRAEFVRRWWASQTAPMHSRVPPYLVVTSQPLLDALGREKLLHWLFWQVESATLIETAGDSGPVLADDALAFVSLGRPATEGTLTVHPVRERPPELVRQARRDAVFWMLGQAPLRRLVTGDGPGDLGDPEASPGRINGILLRAALPGLADGAPAVLPGLDDALGLLRGSDHRHAGQRRWSWRAPSIRFRSEEHRILRARFDDRPVLPRLPAPDTPSPGPEIGILADAGQAGRLPALLHPFQAERARGARLHLYVMEDTAPHRPRITAQVDSITLLGRQGFHQVFRTRKQFEGVPLPVSFPAAIDARVPALMFGLDRLHCLGRVGHARILGALRGLGIVTVLHMPDGTDTDAATDHALIRAYEHAFDLLVAPDVDTAAYLHACGVPSDKLRVADARDGLAPWFGPLHQPPGRAPPAPSAPCTRAEGQGHGDPEPGP